MENEVTRPSTRYYGSNCQPSPVSRDDTENAALVEVFPSEMFRIEMRPTNAKPTQNKKDHHAEEAVGEYLAKNTLQKFTSRS